MFAFLSNLHHFNWPLKCLEGKHDVDYRQNFNLSILDVG